MKKLFTTLVSLLLAICIYAQDAGDAKKFNVTWGTPYQIPKKNTDQGYIGNLTDGLVQISQKIGKELCLQRFDPIKMNKTKETIIDMNTMPDDYTAEAFVELNGKYYMFYSTWEKSEKKENLFAQELDINKCAFAGSGQALLQADQLAGTLISTGFYQFGTANKYSFNYSDDRSKVLVTYRIKPKERNDDINKDVIGFYVFDNKMQKMWGKEMKMPYSEAMMNNQDYSVDSKGNAYMLCKVFDLTKKDTKNDIPNYYYEVLKIAKGDQPIQKIKVDIEKKFINELYMTEDPQHNMAIGGYYRNEARSGGTDGVFVVKIDESGNISKVNKGYYEFPIEVLKQFENEKSQKKIDKKDSKDGAEVPSLEMRKLLFAADGTTMIIGEQYHVVSRTYTSSNGSSNTTYTYYYQDIYVMKIAANGELAWVKKIPKIQIGKKGRGSMSFSNFNIDGNSYFFYLDNIKNLNLSVNAAPEKAIDGAGGFLTVCKLDANGNQTKGKLFDIRTADVNIWPADFEIIGPNTIVGRAYSDKVSKMMRIEFKK